MSTPNGSAAPIAPYVPPVSSLQQRQDHNPLAFTPRGLDELFKFAEKIAASGLVPEKLREKPADLAIVLMHGLELGFTAMQSLAEVYVVEGRPSTSAKGAVGLILRSGVCLDWTLVESTDKKATFSTLRKGQTKPTAITYTIEQAARKPSFKKEGSNWQKDPEAMLRARASMALARVVYPDVLMGLIAREEIEDDELATARNVTPVAEPKPPVVRVPAPSPAPTVEVIATARELTPLPTKAADAAPAEPQAISAVAVGLIERANAAMSTGDLDAVASETNAAKRKGNINPADVDAIKAAVQAKRAAVGA